MMLDVLPGQFKQHGFQTVTEAGSASAGANDEERAASDAQAGPASSLVRGTPTLAPPSFPVQAELRLVPWFIHGAGSDGHGAGADGECPGGTWTTLAPMPSRRQELSTAAYNGEIFTIAGYNELGQSTSTVEVYSPDTKSWRTAASLPIATNHNAAAVAAGTLYAFGGTSNRVFAYDPKNDAWNEVSPMHFQHGNTPAVAVVNDLIYVAGGNGPGMTGNEVEVYNPSKDTWTTVASMHVPRNHTGGGVIDGKIYVAAGRDGPGSETALEVYDPQQDSWSQLSSMPTGRSGVGVAAVGECLYVFGGQGSRIFPEVEAYHPATDTWQRLDDMPIPRHGIFASVVGNAVYLAGGATQPGFAATNANEVFVVGDGGR
jgi:N-acetylneuraminic acid mutarotase